MCTSHVSILSPPRGDTFHADKKREITLDARLICFRVLKPPGGGSSDIFGAAPDETSPRRVKNHQQSQLGSTLFGETANSNSSNETPRNKPAGIRRPHRCRPAPRRRPLRASAARTRSRPCSTDTRPPMATITPTMSQLLGESNDFVSVEKKIHVQVDHTTHVPHFMFQLPVLALISPT
ncbi:microtubule-associated protein Jupiter-like isoform X4 [Ceratina calcarata]|uniref:Microtubule-associated protein Jupiter-like isoform X4 n=1 Tax=Ceratina calcarata TaxID=156304 RepID=A0AAJ7SB12_9HYME|nr:microtubule-associated protein Jupiter-like isoform X4 [Ceratina calcarata]